MDNVNKELSINIERINTNNYSVTPWLKEWQDLVFKQTQGTSVYDMLFNEQIVSATLQRAYQKT